MLQESIPSGLETYKVGYSKSSPSRTWIELELNQMEHLEGEQYSQYPMEGNSRGYMTMRDYRNLPWQWQQPVERNPNSFRTMREYRDQWMSTPSYSVIPTYAPPQHPQYTSLSHPQPLQPISRVEQAILDLTKLVGDAVEEQKEFNAQLSLKNPYCGEPPGTKIRWVSK